MAVRFTTSPWADSTAPTSKDLGKLAEQAYRALPQSFHAMCGDIAIRIDEVADMDLIEYLGGSSPYDLMGLFYPAGETYIESDDSANASHTVVIYRRAILDYWAESEETLGDIVTHIIVQEIGRQFGLNPDQLEEVEIATRSEAERDAKSMMQ